MKKWILLTSLSFVFLMGCEQRITEEPSNETDRFAGLHGTISIITDKETGCKYLREEFGYSNGLTVLMKSDGTPDCGQ